MSTFTHLIYDELHHIIGFNRFNQFHLVSESIDGGVSAKSQWFANFEEVKIKLPEIIENLEFFGEWSLSLIQLPFGFIQKATSMKNELPEKGIKIFELSYMNFSPYSRVIITNSLIHFYSELLEGKEDWEQTDPSINFETTETNITILLNEEIHEVRFQEEDYQGDVDLIYKKYYEPP